MARQDNAAPVIIKRKKVVARHEHHGGAWKVAYADFVTAMMAFFLLMWLLNATTEKQRKGLSDYFNPSVPINRISGGGDGVLGGDSLFSDETRSKNASGGQAELRPDAASAEGDAAAEAEVLRHMVEQALFDRGGESRTMEQLLRHVITRVTDEGLVIELFDLPGAPLFEGDSATPRPATRALASLLANVLALTRNRVGIAGHLRSLPVPGADDAAWQLSGDRAQVMRRLLQQAGLAPERMQRVTGHGDRIPATADPSALRNNRIEIILLRRDR